MEFSLNNLQSPKGNKTKQRRGRGNGSNGTYAGRGMKGQRSRSGGKSGLALRGLKARLISIPKLRGFKSLNKKAAIANLSQLEKHFNANELVNPKALTSKGVIDSPRFGVKILSDGELTKAVNVEGCKVSSSAKAKIEKAGGSVK